MCGNNEAFDLLLERHNLYYIFYTVHHNGLAEEFKIPLLKDMTINRDIYRIGKV